MKKQIFTLLFFLFTHQIYSQYNLDWGKLIGGRTYETAMDKDSNIYLSGNFDNVIDFDPGLGTDMKSTQGGYDFFVVKLDKNGNYKWSRTFGTGSCAPCHDEVTDIDVDSKGNVILVGAFFGPLDFDPHPVNTFIMRSGGFYTVNYMLKLDSIGDFVWAKKFQNNIFSTSDAKVKINKRDQIIYSTSFMDSIDADPSASTLYFTTNSVGNNNSLIAKLKPSGNLIWAKQLKGGTNSIDELTLLDSNSLIIGGKFKGNVDFDIRNSMSNSINSGTNKHSYVLKLTSDTVLQFVKEITSEITINTIHSSFLGPIFIGGSFQSATDFDPGASSVIKNPTTTADAFILKLSDSGRYEDVFTFGGTGIYLNQCKTIAEDTFGNLFFSGEYMSTVDFDKSANTSNHTSNGTLDIFVLKTDSSLNYLNSFSIGGNQWDMPEKIYLLDNNNLLLIGSFTSTNGDLDPSSSSFPIAMPTGNVVGNFTLKLTMTNPTSKISIVNGDEEINLFPNPTNNWIKINGVESNYELNIYNTSGQLVLQKMNYENNSMLDISLLSDGMYSIIIKTENNRVISKKLIKY